MKKSSRIILALIALLAAVVVSIVFIPIGGSSSIIDQADSVRLYRINWDKDHPNPRETFVDEEGNLNSSRVPKDGILLDPEDLKKLKKAAKSSLYQGMLAAICHHPHHAIVLYDDEQKILASMTICFMCSNVSSGNPKLDPYWDIDKLREFIESKGVPISDPDWN